MTGTVNGVSTTQTAYARMAHDAWAEQNWGEFTFWYGKCDLDTLMYLSELMGDTALFPPDPTDARREVGS